MYIPKERLETSLSSEYFNEFCFKLRSQNGRRLTFREKHTDEQQCNSQELHCCWVGEVNKVMVKVDFK